MKEFITFIVIFFIKNSLAWVLKDSEDMTKIIGSVNVAPGEAKFVASLRDPAPFCSGAIIHHNWILTAAHCLEGRTKNRVQVIVGTVLYGDCKNSTGHAYDAKEFKTFGDPHDFERFKDVALIKTAQSIDFNEHVGPIKLATANDQITDDFFQFYGWNFKSPRGSSKNILQTMLMVYMDYKTCVNETNDEMDVRNRICAVAGEHNRLCVGDSSGLLVLESKGSPVLYGMVTFAYSCMVVYTPYPDVFSDIRLFEKKIHDVIDHS